MHAADGIYQIRFEGQLCKYFNMR